MADKIQKAHRKITQNDSRQLRDAFNKSQISDRNYISQRNNGSGILQTESSLILVKNRRGRSSYNMNTMMMEPNYLTNPTQVEQQTQFDEQSPFVNTNDHTEWFKRTSKKISDNKKLLY
jgi:hypothetical protein